METLQEERNILDHSQALDDYEKPIQDELNDSDTEQLSGSGKFNRGSKVTRSLGRSFKNLEFFRSTQSVSSERKSGNFLTKVFNQKSKKDTLKEQKLQLQKELENTTDKYDRLMTKLDQLLIDNKRLADENTALKNNESRLETEIEKLKDANKMMENWKEEILSSVGQALKSYGETFDKFDFDGYEREEVFSVDNLQIGSGNTQTIITADLKLFSQYQKHLENIMQELKQTKQSLQISKTFQENMGNQILTLDGVLEEVKAALTDVKNTKKREVSMELLDYTLSLTEPRVMKECVYELKNLPQRSKDYLFNDLKGNAKIGVLRIFKKYEKRINYRRFVQRLEMDDAVDKEMLHGDKSLTKDDCTSLLVKWASLHQENDADTLVERFPRIKPGRYETRRDKVTFPFTFDSNSMESLNSNDDLAQKTEQFRERLIEDVKEIVQQEMHSIKPELEEIKSAMFDTRREAQFV